MTSAPRHPLIPRREVDPRQELPALELEILERWRERDVFAQSLRAREGARSYVFYEGPPTANGPPGSHHVLSRVFKDIYPRYKTMRGYRVERKGGWDCHGLPVEIAVERELGIGTKAEIEEYGIAEFNARCRESVFTYLQEWNRLTERIGFWLDLDHAYRTLDDDYIESVWWALAAIHEKGLLYEGHKVVPYCPRCGTALSSHEVAQGYRDVVDPSVYVRLPARTAGGARGLLREGDELLVWTTTPWTLPSNAAVAVDRELTYVRARDGDPAHPVFVLAEALAERVLGAGVEILDRFPGSELEGAGYLPPFDYIAGEEYGSHGHTVLAGDFVSAEDGTGLVHTALAFGEDDFRLGERYGMTVVNPVGLDGRYDERIGAYAGRFVKDADAELIEDLRARGRVLRAGDYEHSYPHCWRCGTALLYYAKPSWYIATSQVRERMLQANETVTWHPPHIKHGRFGDWLQNNVDWAISRERYWGTPLPVWRCEQDHVHVIGSFAELEERSGSRLEDPHRPYVDAPEFPCPRCELPMRRVPEVIDVWFDSGAMPFAQHHAPLENEARFEERFPADFVCEALDQTRGWFYSLLAVSSLLFDTAPYRNVMCLGLILDSEGRKMSKSKGNTVEPWAVIDTYGADAFRWYFFTSKQPWDGYRFSAETIGEGVRLFLKQLWSTYYFYTLYAGVNADGLGAVAEQSTVGIENDLDRWALSRAAATARTVTERLDAYDATSAGRAIAEFADELSNWYVRRSRRRFWDGDVGAFQTLRACLLTVAKLLAPFCPFVADEIYDNLDGELASVHLCEFPDGAGLPARDEELEQAMATVRETVRLGLGARGQAKIKVRQPLREAAVVADGHERAAIERLVEIVREELNVGRVRFVSGAEELGRYEVKANYRTLGPRFGRDMPLAAKAIAALDPAHVAAAVRGAQEIGIAVAGGEHSLSAEDVILSMQAPEGYSVEREGAHAVALDLTIDEDLAREGVAREIVHAVQIARKNAGLAVEDRIVLSLDGDAGLLPAAAAHRDYLAGETLAVELHLSNEPARHPQADTQTSAQPQTQAPDDMPTAYREQAMIDGLELAIALRRA
ncbi:MAG TPA: isoleucine--tRNA ligase [Solirubrobacteraceae bacterium]|nr:isoleucine--tRNA ligase [Solirubrobacteraceae bacterium]